MSLNHLKTWPINQKIIASIAILIFSILVFGGIAGLFIQEEINVLEDSSVGSRVTQLAQDHLDKKVNDVNFFKEIQQLIQDTDASILNKAFYVQIGYNLVVFMGLSLVFIKLFQVNELKSLTFKNKSVFLFLVADSHQKMSFGLPTSPLVLNTLVLSLGFSQLVYYKHKSLFKLTILRLSIV